MCCSSPSTAPSPRAVAASGVTMKPAPCSFTPGELMPRFDCRPRTPGDVRASLEVCEQPSSPCHQTDVDRVLLLGLALRLHFEKAPFLRPARPHRHRNPHRRPIRRIHPRMVRNRERQRQRILRLELRLHDAAVEGLLDAVGGDEPSGSPARRARSRRCATNT